MVQIKPAGMNGMELKGTETGIFFLYNKLTFNVYIRRLCDFKSLVCEMFTNHKNSIFVAGETKAWPGSLRTDMSRRLRRNIA